MNGKQKKAPRVRVEISDASGQTTQGVTYGIYSPHITVAFVTHSALLAFLGELADRDDVEIVGALTVNKIR